MDSARRSSLGRLGADRLLTVACLGALTLLAWAYLALLAVRMSAGDMSWMGMTAMPVGGPMNMDESMSASWTAATFWLMALMWLIMMVGMMIPSALPAILLHARVQRHYLSDSSEALAISLLFAAGYVIAWAGFSLIATSAQWGLTEAGGLDPMSMSAGPILAAALFAVAGSYQLSPLKRACLRHCRSPAEFLSAHRRSGRIGAMITGLHHGLYCVGCCWLLMALLFAGGVMNLLWVFVIAVFVLVEKLFPYGSRVAFGSGVLMLFFSVFLLLGNAEAQDLQDVGEAAESQQGEPNDLPIEAFFQAASLDPDTSSQAQAQIATVWRSGYAPILVDLVAVLSRTSFVDPRGFVQLARLVEFLSEQTGQSFGTNIGRWRRWVWSLPYEPHPAYGEFKGRLYATLDPRFEGFFVPPVAASIRLDEVQWGGVPVNGIPPLEYPSVIDAADADYLDDGNIVFGFVVNGEARAYPKRILAWHELALDRVGGEEITLVYCTLCGTVIPFSSVVGGLRRRFGTSGLLYQSNKLMFDEATRSLWSSLTGEPVIGPLVGSGLKLAPLPVVTTTWGEWRNRHPESRVLSLDTGFERDYSEGAAYGFYFSHDDLMFDVSRRDGRLPNKAEVLVIRSLEGGAGETARDVPPYAIAADLLDDEPVHRLSVDGANLVVLTSEAGANRVYASGAHRFERLVPGDAVVDSDGGLWSIREDRLQAQFDADLAVPRVAAHRAFWFGWYAQHPDTVLVR